VEFVGFFFGVGEDELLSGETVLDGVEGAALFTGLAGCAGAGLGILAVCFDLLRGGHVLPFGFTVSEQRAKTFPLIWNLAVGC